MAPLTFAGHPWQFYAKLSAACFVMGGCMEGFMIKTGFYDRVTSIEAGRIEERREEREAFLEQLRTELLKQADAKGGLHDVPAIEALREGKNPAKEER